MLRTLAMLVIAFGGWTAVMALALQWAERRNDNEIPMGLLFVMFYVALPLSFVLAGGLLGWFGR